MPLRTVYCALRGKHMESHNVHATMYDSGMWITRCAVWPCCLCHAITAMRNHCLCHAHPATAMRFRTSPADQAMPVMPHSEHTLQHTLLSQGRLPTSGTCLRPTLPVRHTDPRSRRGEGWAQNAPSRKVWLHADNAASRMQSVAMTLRCTNLGRLARLPSSSTRPHSAWSRSSFKSALRVNNVVPKRSCTTEQP
jgi:hypothetical protein